MHTKSIHIKVDRYLNVEGSEQYGVIEGATYFMMNVRQGETVVL